MCVNFSSNCGTVCWHLSKDVVPDLKPLELMEFFPLISMGFGRDAHCKKESYQLVFRFQSSETG